MLGVDCNIIFGKIRKKPPLLGAASTVHSSFVFAVFISHPPPKNPHRPRAGTPGLPVSCFPRQFRAVLAGLDNQPFVQRGQSFAAVLVAILPANKIQRIEVVNFQTRIETAVAWDTRLRQKSALAEIGEHSFGHLQRRA